MTLLKIQAFLAQHGKAVSLRQVQRYLKSCGIRPGGNFRPSIYAADSGKLLLERIGLGAMARRGRPGKRRSDHRQQLIPLGHGIKPRPHEVRGSDASNACYGA